MTTQRTGPDWAHRPAMGHTIRTAPDGTVTSERCATCPRPLVLDPDDDNPATQWHPFPPATNEHGDAWCSECGERLLLPGYAGGPVR